MNEEILQNIWNQLTSDGMTESDFETWKVNFAGSEEIQKNIHSYLVENNYTSSDIDTWNSNVGLKKKESPELPGNGVEEVTDVSTEEIQTPSGELESISILENTIVDGTPFTELNTDEQQNYINSIETQRKSLREQNSENSRVNLISPLFQNTSQQFEQFEEDFIAKQEADANRTEEQILADQEYDGFMDSSSKQILALNKYMKGNAKKNTEVINGQRVQIKPELDSEETLSNTEIPNDVFYNTGIDKNDYLVWKTQNRRKEDSSYKQVRDLFFSEKSERKIKEGNMSANLAAYTRSLGDAIEGDIDRIDNQLKFVTDPVIRKQLLETKKGLQNDLVSNIKTGVKISDNFKYLKKTIRDDVKERKELFLSGRQGGASYFVEEGKEAAKNGADAVLSFFGGLIGFVPSITDAITTGTGFDDKGIMSALVDSLGNSMEINKLGTARSSVTQGKPVTANVLGKETEVFVTSDGDIVDKKTNVSLQGIVSDAEYKNILNKAKEIKRETVNITAGSAVSGLTSTIVNLGGLILGAGVVKKTVNKGLKKLGSQKSIKASGGMGLTSYASGVMQEVESIKRELINAGLSEQEATAYAVTAGNAKASLDGIFSTLAGGNTKLLSNTKGVGKKIIDLARNPKSWVKQGGFQGKVKDLVNENLKELFIEELPVLFSGKAINGVVNSVLGAEILNSGVSQADTYETVIMTLGATTGLGSVGLLSGNKRKDLLRYVALSDGDLTKKIDNLVSNGMISKEEGAKVYSEIYEYQTALNKTKDQVSMSENILPAGNLLEQRQRLMEKREGLEGPLKEKVDAEIADVDKQLTLLLEKDNAQATGKVEVTKQEAVEALKAENEVRLKSKLPAILESEANILKKQEELIKDKQDAVQESDTDSKIVEEKITLEELNKPDTFTHRTMSKDAITNWADGGQVIGKKEDLKDFDSRVPNNPLEAASKKEGFNRQSPNFQKGGVYSGKVKPGEFVVVAKGDNKFIPSASFQNRKTFEKSSGISTLKPDSRQLSNFDLYKVNEKGELVKQNWDNYKTNKDAIQESSTKGVDVQKQTGDGQKVVKGDTTGAVTNQSQKETESETKKSETEIVAREKIAQPIRVPNSTMDVNLNPDGTVKSIVKKGTKKTASKQGIKKAGKFILTNVVDVNAGKEAVIPEGITNPNDVSNIISDQSENVKQVAQEIENERKRFLEEKNSRNQMADVEGGINEIIGMKFTAESWERLTGLKPSEDGVSSRWISKNGRSIEDGWVDDAPDLTLEQVTEFIKAYPTTKAINEYQKGDTGITNNIDKLKERFKKLTGLEATDSNIDTVLSIDPNREPIEATKEKARTQASKDSTDPNVPDFGKKKGPSAKKILGIKSKKNIEVDEIKGLKDVLKREIKRSKDLLLDQKTRRKALVDSIKMLAKIPGNITNSKAAALIKAVTGVNVNNADAVLKVTNYVEKVFQNANNKKKLSTANNVKKRIKKLLKSKKAEANVQASVEQFLLIQPELVNDLDNYLEKLSDVLYKLQPSKADLKGIESDLDGIQLINEPDAKIKKFNKRASVNPEAVNIAALDEYSKKTIDEQREKLYDAEKQVFEDLTDLDSKEFTLAEMREVLNTLDPKKDLDFQERKLKVKPGAVAEAVKKAFNTFSALIKSELGTKTDPLTGEKTKIPTKDVETILGFMKMDLDLLRPEQQMLTLDALVNYATNKTTGGMEAMLESYKGIKNADALSKTKGFVSKGLKFAFGGKGFARTWATQISTLNNVIEQLFKGQSKALEFEQMSGISEYKRGTAKATKMANDVISAYSKKFIENKGRLAEGLSNVFKSKKQKEPNGEPFNSLYNDTERGLFAFMRRTVIGSEKQQNNEFNRRKKLIVDSIKELEQGDDAQKERAVAYQKAYDKVLKESKTINDLESKVDAVNVEAVNFITQEWAKNKEALDKVSLNVYNKILGKDLNYTTDVFTKISEPTSELELGESIYNTPNETVYSKKTGVLMEAQRPNNLPKNSIIDLGFDSGQTRALEKALTDVYTANATQKLKGFVSSDGFKKLIPEKTDRDLFINRLTNFVNLKRKVNQEFEKDQNAKNIIDYIASIGVSRALGSIVQFPKQLVPLIATVFNAGAIYTSKGVNLLRKKSVQEFINNSGYAIANRGVENITTLDGSNRKIDRAAEGGLRKAAKAIGNLNQTWLKGLLVKPDKIAARASWIAYYMKALKKEGIDPNSIDWNTHKVNTKAGDYAQQQVDRQQNTSDSDLQGNLFTSKNVYIGAGRKIFFAFSNFLLNQKTRMYNDIGVLSSKTTNREDKKAAARSLSGLMAETLTFNSMGYFLGQAISELAFGDEEDEETKEKTKQNRIKGRSGNVIKDLLSPIPITDPIVMKAVNKIISLTSESDKPFQFFTNDKRTFFDTMGVLGIAGKNLDTLWEMAEMGVTGKYNVEFMGKLTKKELTDENKEKLYFLFTSYLMYTTGLVPADVGPIVEKSLKLLKKQSASTIKTREKYIKNLNKKKKKTTRRGLPKSPLSKKRRSGLPKSPVRL
jgi:hypothetical protein